MNIFFDLHTYLIISFFAMLIFLYKFTYKKFNDSLNISIEKIKTELIQLEDKKKNLTKDVDVLLNHIENMQIDVKDSILNAEIEAKKIADSAIENISKVVEKKQMEYDEAIEKIKNNLLIDLQNRIIKLVIENTIEKFKSVKSNHDLQNINIENSQLLIENWIDENNTLLTPLNIESE